MKDTARIAYKRVIQKVVAKRNQTKNGSIRGRVPVSSINQTSFTIPCQAIKTAKCHIVYISIQYSVVKPWILDMRAGRINPFILEEDGDSGHRGGKAINPVRR